MASRSPSPSLASKQSPAEGSRGFRDGMNTSQEKEYLKGFKLYILLASLTLVTFLVFLDIAIIGTAIPHITTQFHSLSDVGWYVGAYTLGAAALQPLSGKFYTYFNTKTVYLCFVFAFEIGSLVCGVAPSSPAFIIGRVLAGLGASGLVNGGMTILSGAIPLEKSPKYTGILMAISQMGVVAGPLIGGTLTEHATWRWCFYMNLPIGGVAALILVSIQIPDPTIKAKFSMGLIHTVIPELDLFGWALFVPAIIMFLLALQFGNGSSYTWDSATVIGLFCGAGVNATIFVLWERKMGEKAMLPGPLLRQRVIWCGCMFGTCMMACMSISSNWIPTYFQAVKGDGPTMSGVHVLPNILSQLLIIIISGGAVSRFGYYLPWALSGSIIVSIGSGLLSTLTASSSTGTWVGYQILFGLGRGAALQVAYIAVQNAVERSQVPIALSMLIFFQNLGTSAATVIANTIFTQTLASAVPRYAPSVSPGATLSAGSGASAVRNLVAGHEDELNGVLKAYSESLRNVFYFLAGMSVLAVVLSLGLGWKDVRRNTQGDKLGDGTMKEDSVAEKGEV